MEHSVDTVGAKHLFGTHTHTAWYFALSTLGTALPTTAITVETVYPAIITEDTLHDISTSASIAVDTTFSITLLADYSLDHDTTPFMIRHQHDITSEKYTYILL